MSVRLHIAKDTYKFSSAHMTIFPDGTKENLHGHNYQVELGVELGHAPAFREMIDFRDFKKPLKELCDRWDEKILLAARNPHFEVLARNAHDTEFRCCGKRYVLPTDELVILEVDNITSENLAQLLAEAYADRIRGLIPPSLQPARVRLTVLETRGQGASVEVAI